MSVINAVADTGESHRSEYIITVLIGRATDEIRRNGHDQLESFGALVEMDEKIVAMLVKQLFIAGYLSKDLDNYGILKVTPEGREFARNPGHFEIIKDVDYSDTVSDTQTRGLASGALDPALFRILSGLRKYIARKKGIAPYLVFMDPSLECMATLYPVTIEELLTVPGVGAGKAARYGREFVELIKKYVEENEIERPSDVRVKFAAKKTNPKVSIIQAIDRKIDLEEICESLGKEFSDFLDELETIVEAGIKIDISYFVNEIFEEDQIEEIYDYFRNSEDGNVESAIQELGAAYDEEDIRLIRVMFLSEVAN